MVIIHFVNSKYLRIKGDKQHKEKTDLHIGDFYTQMLGSHCHKLLIALQHCSIVTFDLNFQRLVQLVQLFSSCLYHIHTSDTVQLTILNNLVQWCSPTASNISTTVRKIHIKPWNPERLPEQCTSKHLCYYRGRQIFTVHSSVLYTTVVKLCSYGPAKNVLGWDQKLH